jgi:hypothetical protein
MFLLQWDATEAIQRFEDVAGKTFEKKKALLARAIQLVTAYVEDGQYSLAAVQDAFQKAFGTSIQMFNPLRNDTKVAVTTTAVKDSLPWLFTNYNGGRRSENLGWYFVACCLLTLIKKKATMLFALRDHTTTSLSAMRKYKRLTRGNVLIYVGLVALLLLHGRNSSYSIVRH